MKTAIVVHGTPSEESFLDEAKACESNRHWIPWIQKQLLVNGYHCWAPDMPIPYAPDYDLWKEEFERYSLKPDSLLVGHSCGGGFLLRYLSENPITVKKLVLIAPWLDPDKRKCPDFFQFDIDPELYRRMELHIFSSDNDDQEIHRSEAEIRSKLPSLKFHQFHNHGHFCETEMPSLEFPKLKQVLLGH